MRAYTSMYEEPSFEDATRKEQSVVYAALGAAAVAVASTVAAIQMHGAPAWLTAARSASRTTEVRCRKYWGGSLPCSCHLSPGWMRLPPSLLLLGFNTPSHLSRVCLVARILRSPFCFIGSLSFPPHLLGALRIRPSVPIAPTSIYRVPSLIATIIPFSFSPSRSSLPSSSPSPSPCLPSVHLASASVSFPLPAPWSSYRLSLTFHACLCLDLLVPPPPPASTFMTS